jgi:hypothetical protein
MRKPDTVWNKYVHNKSHNSNILLPFTAFNYFIYNFIVVIVLFLVIGKFTYIKIEI